MLHIASADQRQHALPVAAGHQLSVQKDFGVGQDPDAPPAGAMGAESALQFDVQTKSKQGDVHVTSQAGGIQIDVPEASTVSIKLSGGPDAEQVVKASSDTGHATLVVPSAGRDTGSQTASPSPNLHVNPVASDPAKYHAETVPGRNGSVGTTASQWGSGDVDKISF